METIIDLIRRKGIRVILSANYFDSAKPEIIAERTGAEVVVVPLSTGGEPGIDGYEDLIDVWISRKMPPARDFFAGYSAYVEAILERRLPIFRYEQFCLDPEETDNLSLYN